MPKPNTMATPRKPVQGMGLRVRAVLESVRERLHGRSLPTLAIGLGSLLLLVLLGLQVLSGNDRIPATESAVVMAEDLVEGADDMAAFDETAARAEAVEPNRLAQADDQAVLDASVWAYVQIDSGDTLELVFRRLGLSPGLLFEVANLDQYGRALTRIRPGDEFAFDIDHDGTFRALRTALSEDEWVYVEQGADGLSVRTEPRVLETRVVEVEAEITSSLFNAAKNAGLSDNMTLRLASIFAWDIDFALDIRQGDRFALVYEDIYREGQFLRQGSILAARFINQGDSFEAIRFDAGEGPDFYDANGRPMRKAFLRAPLNFTRVTSNFNPRRFHPVTRRIAPHNGTDYGGAVGTPIWAAGDGTV
ncbi:MAG: LysM-like peptidoglycan-binding domain-containing protein, partial [Pseudomonadota bacterium]